MAKALTWGSGATSATINTDVQSDAIDLDHFRDICIQVISASATRAGTVTFQGRLKGGTEWATIPKAPSLAVSASTAFEETVELHNLLIEEIRVAYTSTTGTGTLAARYTKKGA